MKLDIPKENLKISGIVQGSKDSKNSKHDSVDCSQLDIISSLKADSAFSKSLSQNEELSLDGTPASFPEIFDEQKEIDPNPEDIQMPEVSSTESVKNVTDYSPSMDVIISMDNSWSDKSLDIVSPDTVASNKPRIIANEKCEKKILLCRDQLDIFNKSDDFDNNKDSESYFEAEDFLGFPTEGKEESSFQKLRENVEQETIAHNFSTRQFRDISIISRPETPSMSYLRLNLPDQVEPLGLIIHKKNLIRSSMFNFSTSGYTELVPIMQKCRISGSSNRKRRLKARIRSKRSRNRNKLKSPILQKAKLNLQVEKTKGTEENREEKENEEITKGKKKQDLKKKEIANERRIEKNENEEKNLENFTKEESNDERIQTRSSLKVLSQSLKLSETPPYQRITRRKKLVFSRHNHMKDLRILLSRIDISLNKKQSPTSTPIKKTVVPNIDKDNCETNNNAYKEYAHLEYMDTSPALAVCESLVEKQSLPKKEKSSEKIISTRKSPRLNKQVRKGIIILTPKGSKLINRRVTFSPDVMRYEF